ncbi:NGFI-A-binding protein homolog [Thrips palmi]|uniref:NGFI-A-binding protein homolog n=1 Tax=Thrips palmi TaxID=161013 RepID=A0A6P8Y485_THRPL|nr:NGFI-A-binding protein homolog [Thrips palmi]
MPSKQTVSSVSSGTASSTTATSPQHPATPTSPATVTSATSTPPSASPMGPVGGVLPPGVPGSKILGRNTNGTVVMTSVPSNEAELQLYRVMQRASLLAYYDTLLEMGGDDVQQLCEAGEEEFLEIMALVGMASKPLHVRRLQKALQEWFNNPAQFQMPLGPTPAFPVTVPRPVACSAAPQSTTHPGTLPAPRSSPGPGSAPSPAPDHLGRLLSPVTVRSTSTPPSPSRSPADHAQNSVGSVPTDFSSASTTTTTTTSTNNQHNHQHNHHSQHHHPYHHHVSPSTSPLQGGPGRPLPPPLSSPTPSSTPMSLSTRSTSPSLQLTPVLLESQVQRLAEAARNLSRTLPSCQPKPHNTKKKVCKDLELVINMSDDDPRRMDEVRKYAAIYGRFDCKRKPEKPLTLHEVSVNEAAAQICRFVPALLTRRDELFPLARQVVRDSGYLYSKGHTNLSYYRPRCPSSDDILTAGHKRPKLEPSGSPSPDSSEGDHRPEQQRRQERLEAVSEELRALAERHDDLLADGVHDGLHDVVALHAVRDALQARQMALQAEQAELLRQTLHPRYRRTSRVRSSSLTMDSERGDTDDDSQMSFSNASSPSQEVTDSRDSETAERERGSRSPGKGGGQDGLLDATMVANGVSPYTDSFYRESKVQVIASRGADIIAVANPALSMSAAILAESKSPKGTPKGSPKGSPPPSLAALANANSLLKLEPQSPPQSPETVQ